MANMRKEIQKELVRLIRAERAIDQELSASDKVFAKAVKQAEHTRIRAYVSAGGQLKKIRKRRAILEGRLA